MEANARHGLDRWLHRTYFRGSGVRFFIARRLRPAGFAVGVVIVITGSMGLGLPRDSIYQIFSLALGMALIGLPWAFLRRAKLTALRELPRYATAGETIRYSVTVTHAGKKRRLQRAWLAESTPDPRPASEDFIHQREPGEEKRNAFDRTLAYYRWKWLLLKNHAILGGISWDELDILPGEKRRVSIQLTPLKRGVIRFDDLRVLLPDPFWLFQRCHAVAAPPATLTVLPKRYPLPPLELPGDAAYKIGGDTTSNAIGSAGEFVGLRDYRPGDPLRQIHWKSWARTGKPIVKELEDTHYPRYGLVLDTFSAGGADSVFEDVISVAASFASALDSSNTLLDLMFIKGQAHRVTTGRGLARADRLLEVLAGAEPERNVDFDPLAQLVIRHRDDLTSCVVILNGWDTQRSDFLQRLIQAGIACSPIIIGKGEPLKQATGHWVESGELPRDLARLPNRLRAES